MDDGDLVPAVVQPTSRLCVKNLPKNATEAKLREQFSKFGEVTDAKILRTLDGHSRQMAFIGFKTVEQSTASQKYFHRTFIGASRLQVEFAAHVGSTALPRAWSKYSKGSSVNHKKRTEADGAGDEKEDEKEKQASKKKQKLDPADDEVHPKLAEFLALMQPRSKAKTWANDELAASQEASRTQLQALRAGGKGQGMGHKAEQSSSDDEDGEEDTLYQNLVQELKEKDMAPPAPKDRIVVDTAVSDLDYLKARMKNLGSVGDEDKHDIAAGSNEGDWEEENDDDPQSPKNNAASRGDQSGVGARSGTGVQAKGVSKSGKRAISPKPAAELELGEQGKGEGDKAEEEGDAAEDAKQPLVVESERSIAETGRLFVRNLPYTATEGELMELFQTFGELEEVHLVLDKATKRSKGFAYVSFTKADRAVAAAAELDCSIFQGRLIHILPAHRPPNRGHNPGEEPAQHKEEHGRGGSFKAERDVQRKAEAGSRSAWNTLFMRQDTVAEAIAVHYGVAKSQLLDRDAGDLAVRMALGEAHVISQTKQALADAGVDTGKLEAAAAASGKAAATKSVGRSDSTLLVKNLPYSSTEEDLEELFSKCGEIARVVLPPTHTLALVEFLEPQDARKAFRSLAYKKYQHVPLYLEWAPKNIFTTPVPTSRDGEAHSEKRHTRSKAQSIQGAGSVAVAPDADVDEDAGSCSIYVKNLAFTTTAARLRSHFDKTISAVGGRLVSCKLMTRKGPDGKDLSRGFGFLEVDTEEVARLVLKQMQGTTLDSHQLSLQLSRKNPLDGPTGQAGKAGEQANKPQAAKDAQSTTLVVRNLAFEATNKDVVGLFSPFGHIKACRLPKKFDGTIRGFAFVEFVTKQEAKQAMEGVTGTHLYGRRLVVEYAKEERSLEDLRAKTAAKFIKGEGL